MVQVAGGAKASRTERTRRQKAAIVGHLREMAGWFNAAAEEYGIPVSVDADEAAATVEGIKDWNSPAVDVLWASMANRIHREQVETAMEAIASSLKEVGRSGLITGALQSGKTGTAHSMLFAAPIHWLMNGLRIAPLILSTSQRSHQHQTKKELRAFLALYGGIPIIRGEGTDPGAAISLSQHFADLTPIPVDLETPDDERDQATVSGRISELAGEMNLEMTDVIGSLVSEVAFGRNGGVAAGNRIRRFFERANDCGYAVMMLVDEPQWGAMDMPDARRPDGVRPAVLSQYLSIAEECGINFRAPTSLNFLVALSATPFELTDMEDLFQVRQRLGDGYVGFPFFAGRKLDERSDAVPPRIASLSEMGADIGGFELGDLNYQLFGHAKGSLTKRMREKVYRREVGGRTRPMTGSQRRDVGRANILSLLDATLGARHEATADAGRPVGALVRFSSTGTETNSVLDLMDADSADFPYNVIRVFDDAHEEGDMKRRIARATADDPRPYMVVVAAKGRMGDAFPPSTQVAIDLTYQASDMNALLQGVFGRMCGYGKVDPLVVLSDRSTQYLRDYGNSMGLVDDLAQSRGARVENRNETRVANESRVVLTRDMLADEPGGSPLHALFASLEGHLAYLNRLPPSVDVPQVHRNGGSSWAPIKGFIQNDAAYLRDNHKRLFPWFSSAPDLMPIEGRIVVGNRKGETEEIGYRERKDSIQVLVRAYAPTAHDAERSLLRLQNERRDIKVDGSTRQRGLSKGILPLVLVEKLDGQGNPVAKHVAGHFRLYGISFDLERPVRTIPEIHANRKVVPHAFHALGGLRTVTERGELALSMIEENLDWAEDRRPAAARRKAARLELRDAMTRNPATKAAVSALFDKSTHSIEILSGRSFRVVEKATGNLGNPMGPAIVDLDSERQTFTYALDGKLIDAAAIDGARRVIRPRLAATDPEADPDAEPQAAPRMGFRALIGD